MLAYEIFRFLVGRFSIFLLSFIFTKYDHYLCIQIPLNQFLPHDSTISTYMRYFHVVLSKFVCDISNFKINFSFVCSYCSWNGTGWLIYFHARYVILKMSVYSLVIARECGGYRDAQSQDEKEIYFMSNNKFLGKCWYGRHPWIRLTMESESYGGKMNKLYFMFRNHLGCI